MLNASPQLSLWDSPAFLEGTNWVSASFPVDVDVCFKSQELNMKQEPENRII